MTVTRSILSCLLPLCLLAGCGPTAAERRAHRAVDDYHVGDYGRAVHTLRPIAEKPDENFVLNNARLGSAALADYDLDTAENAFLNAYEVINSTGTNSGGRGAAAAIISERMKVWKGEPFEKAMVNFYLGLVYYVRHDYDNARAAFENSLFKLREYGEERGDRDDEYRRVESDFVIGYVMLARCYQRLGDADNARKYFARAAELRPRLRGLTDYGQHDRSNVLLVVDFGQGPRRVTHPYDNAFVGFGPRPEQVGPIPLPRIAVDGQTIGSAGPRGDFFVAPPVDLLALAQEKRWQDIDTIRAVKDVVGTGMIAGGAYMAHRAAHHSHGKDQRRDATYAAALIAAGALLKASSQADVRTWEMLPRTTFLIPLRLPPGRHDVTVDFPSEPGLAQTWRGIVAPDAGDATYYLRIQPTTAGEHTWPPRKPSPAPAPAPAIGATDPR
ncbi:MAG TPA: tetratricopeptide repeat protein [Tepidisphaeraceae bacterium]|nr:tetratricopeptide repeat protein [Tepidisphaeraceae bacterium]